MKNSENDIIEGVNSGSRVCLSKLISLVESDKSAIFRIIDSLNKRIESSYAVSYTHLTLPTIYSV